MNQFEKAKQKIAECSSAMEMIGCLNRLETTAIIYCKKNCPEYLYIDDTGMCEVSIYGMEKFLNSEVN